MVKFNLFNVVGLLFFTITIVSEALQFAWTHEFHQALNVNKQNTTIWVEKMKNEKEKLRVWDFIIGKFHIKI